jgi:cyclophilin family peptidyl-prolyl cis-trans isomerase
MARRGSQSGRFGRFDPAGSLAPCGLLALLLALALVAPTSARAAAKKAGSRPAKTSASKPAPAKGGNPVVVLQTSKGPIEIELDPDKAPETVKNFLAYVDAGFYDGTVFHRVIPNFMIQGGGFDANLNQKPTRAPIKNEADNGLQNRRGTIAMARTSDPNSATAQFFINTVDNDFLNYPRNGGYAVFGQVTAGMDVVDQIAAVKTGAKGPFPKDVPTEPVVIQSAKRKQ